MQRKVSLAALEGCVLSKLSSLLQVTNRGELGHQVDSEQSNQDPS